MQPSRLAGEKGRCGAASFPETHWSVVVAAGQKTTTRSREALSALCKAYWYPLYAYVRRREPNVQDAQDLTQEFFARLLEKGYVRSADRHRGRFRSFLLAALNHFLTNEWHRARAQKRGSGETLLTLDFAEESRRVAMHLQELSPEALYEQQWAMNLLDRVLARLREEYVVANKENLFEELKGGLTGGATQASYKAIAARIGLSEGAVKTAAHRLRKRYAARLQEEIAQTVADPEDVEDEIRHLLAAFDPR